MIPTLLRVAAFAIAIAAVIDPAITTPRTVRADVAVVADTRDDALADRIARTLRDDFRILRAPFGGAAATVVVGTPPRSASLAAPVFVIAPERDAGSVAFESVNMPSSVPLASAVRIDACVSSTMPVEVVLSAGGVTVDRAVTDSSGSARLTWVPAQDGPTSIRLTAMVNGEERAVVDGAVFVHERRWRVLFHDTRPTWASTYVRRALERDPRFDVAFRVVTSRAASVGGGGAPVSLADAASLAPFHAVVIGAPTELNTREANALIEYMRGRGGRVVLLFDSDGPDPLTGVAQWESAHGTGVIEIHDGTDTLRASELRWPRALPPGAGAVAVDGTGRPIVWETAVGAGGLMVSGALDAWRHRDPAASDFAAFWRTWIARSAAAAAPSLEAYLEETALPPGATTNLVITVRDAALAEPTPGAEIQARVSADLEVANEATPVRVLPDGGPGRFVGHVRAPEAPGLHIIRVSSGGAETIVALRVDPAARQARPDPGAHLEAWAASRGGSVIAEDDLDALRAGLVGALNPVRRAETWHPMRSPWWIVPFVLALGGEWWWRRRRGLA